MNSVEMPAWLRASFKEPPQQPLTPRSRKAKKTQEAKHIAIPGCGHWTKGVKYYVAGDLGKGGSSAVYKANLHSNGIDTPCALVVDMTPAGLLSPLHRGQRLKEVVMIHLVAIQILWNRLSVLKPHIPILKGISAIKLDKSPIICARAAIALEILKPLEGDPIRIARQISDIQEMLKSGKILHRDIKPENLMMRADGTVVLIDWDECLFIDDIEGMDETEFEQLLNKLTTTEEFAPKDYGECFCAIKTSTASLEDRKQQLIELELQHEAESFALTIQRIFIDFSE